VLLFAGKHREKVIQTMQERMAELKKEGVPFWNP